MMLLAIEALIRSMIYVRDIWGDAEGDTILFFLNLSILILLFCVLTLKSKFTNLITHKFYLCFALILASAVAIFPFVFLTFEASYQIIVVWGCIAAALYGLQEYTISDEEVMTEKKRRIVKNMLRLCTILIIYVLFLVHDAAITRESRNLIANYGSAIYKYNKLNPGVLSEFSPTETVDITDLLDISDSEYVRAGVVSIVLKNNNYFIQYNIEALFHRNRKVSWFSFGTYRGMSLKDYKKELTEGKLNYNSPDLDSLYDGIGNEYFRKIVF
jgi:hypothetical protein